MKLEVPTKPVESIVFKSDLACIATFRCPAEHELFIDSGPASNHVFVFPRTSTIIEHDGQAPLVSGPNLVMFYNQNDLFRRRKLSPEGDSCDWFVVSDDLLQEVIARYDPAVTDRPHRPFVFTHVTSDPRIYLSQRRLFHYAAREHSPNQLLVEESVLELLDELVSRAYQNPSRCRSIGDNRPVTGRDRDSVELARWFVGEHFLEPFSISDVAAYAGSSVFHLCRQFRNVTGLSIHQYRQRLRLFEALERLEDTGVDLTSLALDLGFSSHSHFTFTFRRNFGVSPSGYRQSEAVLPLRCFRN